METLDLTGMICPVPVITTKKFLDAADSGTQVEVIVDNPTSVENLAKFAEQRHYGFERGHEAEREFHVVFTKTAETGTETQAAPAASESGRKPVRVVAVASRTMGEGDERLGATLLKGFLYALTEQDTVPDTVLFYNGGAHLSAAGSESLDDLRALEAAGVQILTCGTCINHYGLDPKPPVGGVTNMYSIVDVLTHADVVIKP